MSDVIDKVGTTAFFTAYWRSLEARNQRPIFHDPYAELFINPDIMPLAAELMRILPAAPAMVRYRTRYLDDALNERIAAGYTQIVLLGAGFDTRPLRWADRGVRFFEIDRPAVLACKNQILQRAGLNSDSVNIACDYLADDFVAALQAEGLSVADPTYFIWEGNTAYLPDQAIEGTLTTIRRNWSQASLSFDFLSDYIVNRMTGLSMLSEIVNRFADLGSPWIAGYRCAQEVPGAAAWTVLNEAQTTELVHHYGVTDEQHPEILEFYMLCTMEHTAAST